MNISKIPKGEPVLIDANIFIYANQGLSRQCARLLERCAGGECTGIVPAHILAEVMHIFMLAEARELGLISGSNPARQLSENPLKAGALHRYEQLIRDMLSMGLQIEPVQREDFITAFSMQRQYGLLTNDALFISAAARLRVKAIASADAAFKAVRDFTVYAPDDIIFKKSEVNSRTVGRKVDE